MDRNSVNWSGPMPAVTTAFHDNGRIDEAAFAANLEGLIAAGATGFVVGGCTGEFWALSHEERKRLFDVAYEAIAGRVTLIAGTGAVSVEETVALTRHAEAAGCDGALILPPYFVKLSDDEIFAHFADVCAQIGLPVVLYNIPGNAVNAITPALAARLADLERVVAIKESSGDWNNYYGTYLAVHERLRV
jgi:4-hydroxy-tetrahydrodipicolinate synthase